MELAIRLQEFNQIAVIGSPFGGAGQMAQLLDALSKQDEAGAIAMMRRHLERSRHVWGDGDHPTET